MGLGLAAVLPLRRGCGVSWTAPSTARGATPYGSCPASPRSRRRTAPGDSVAAVAEAIGVSHRLPYIKRTTLKLPDALDARLRHEAARRNATISEISREAIEAYLGESGGRRRLAAAGAGRSGRTDISERIEEILAAEATR